MGSFSPIDEELHIRIRQQESPPRSASKPWRRMIIGIALENPNRVFEVFQHLNARVDHDGTGIGLALCKRIIERHGGDIWLDSEPGEGSTCSFSLPARGKDDE